MNKRKTVRLLLQNRKIHLTKWEISFLKNISRKKGELTEKQDQKLNEVYQKYMKKR